jgi:hypothetical protein
VLQPDATHTSLLVGEVKFVDLGEHLLRLAGVRRRARYGEEPPTPTVEAASESQGNQATVTMVAGARFATRLPRFASSRMIRKGSRAALCQAADPRRA